MQRLATLASVVACALVAGAPVSAQAEMNVPPAALKEVRVPGTAPMSAAAVDLARYGYTEREFYAAGIAHRYRGAATSSLRTAEVIDGGWRYRTRVLVRAPRPGHFNGTLIVEWTNVTIGVDADFVFAEAHADFLRQGYAYAVVSVQRVGVDRLKTWSPRRYGTLSVEASNVDPKTGGAIDATNDPLSWDIYTGVAEALKANRGKNPPLPGLKVKNVIATGQSQSAGRLTAYYNTIEPLVHFFNGFVLWDKAMNTLRSNVRVPAVSVDSEALSVLFPPSATSAYTRHWEVAGTTHGSIYAARYVDKMFVRDKGLIGPNGQPESFTQWVVPSCTVLPPFSTVPTGLVIGAAMDSVKRWITSGKAAARSIYFDRDASGQLVRNAEGQVEGGVRLSQFVDPIAQLDAFNGTAFPCSVSGFHHYYSAAQLKARYGSTGNYVARVRSAMHRVEREGYVLMFDAQATIAAAERTRIG